MLAGWRNLSRRTLVKSLIRRSMTALLVMAALAGCAATGEQEPLWDKLDRLLWYNAAD